MNMRVTIFSHNFSVTNIQPAMRPVIEKFASWFDEYEFQEVGGQWEKQFKQSFSFPQADVEEVDWKHPHLEYRFHVNALGRFKQFLLKELVQEGDIDYVIEPVYESATVEFKIKPHFQPFEEQKPMISQLCASSPISKLLPLQTGGGKSSLSLVAAAHWQMRTVYFMKPGYIDKWFGDIQKTLEIDPANIITVMGGTQLQALIRNIMGGYLIPHIVMISNATFRNWISEQEKMPPGEYVPGYDIFPWEFMQACGFGFRPIDEVHQDFHANFRTDLVTHVEQSLSLSATLVTKNEYLKKMYKLMFPKESWVEVPEFRRYIRGIAWHFDFLQPERIKISARGRTSYSHVEFEKSIIRSSKLFKQYLLMIYEVMRKTWMVNRQEPQRCLVYFATREMCELAVMFFRQLLPHLKIHKFNQGDPLKNVTESDLCFATLGKAGTAIDIPFLTTVILTIAVDSEQANLQSSGRLRDLVRLYGLDRIPDFVWFVCGNFEKHKRYHNAKLDLLKDRAALITHMQYNTSLGV